jgi:hypothetical protein
MKFIDEHQTGIRITCLILGAAATIATPFLASEAKTRVSKRIQETGASTKKDKLREAAKEPFVWLTAGTSLMSLGAGVAGYAVSDRVISKTKSVLDKTLDELTTVEAAVSKLPEETKTELQKDIMETKFQKAVSNADRALADGERCLGTAGVPVDTGYGSTLFFDCWTSTWFLSDLNKIQAVINEINEIINSGITMTVADWCIKNGWKPKELDYDYIFTSNIKILRDGEHLYSMDDKGAPVGMIEFTFESKPRHMTEKEKEGLPWI